MSPHRSVEPPQRPLRARVLLILWPSFVMAGVLEMLVFAVVDPSSLHWPGEETLQWSRSTTYSVAFFVFWAVIAVSTAITEYLTRADVR